MSFIKFLTYLSYQLTLNQSFSNVGSICFAAGYMSSQYTKQASALFLRSRLTILNLYKTQVSRSMIKSIRSLQNSWPNFFDLHNYSLTQKQQDKYVPFISRSEKVKLEAGASWFCIKRLNQNIKLEGKNIIGKRGSKREKNSSTNNRKKMI